MSYKVLDNPWRVNYEAISASVWLISLIYSLVLLLTGQTMHTVGSIVASGVAAIGFLYNFNLATQLWRRKANLTRDTVTFLSPAKVKAITRRAEKNKTLFVGYGFHWTQQHTQLVHTIQKTNKDLLEPPLLYRMMYRRPKLDDDMGEAYLHGIGIDEEQEINVPLKHLEGHTLICGTTGCGKTVTFRLLITCCVLQGHSILIIDPKGDKDLLKAVKEACDIAGRSEDFIFFHPAHPSASCRIDPLKNWSRETGIASRIAPLIPSETGADAFVAFCWNAINTIALNLINIGVRPNLKRIRNYIEGGPEDLLFKVLESYFRQNVPNWEQQVKPYVQEGLANKYGRLQNPTAAKELLGYIAFYKIHLRQSDPKRYKCDDIDALISMVEHSRDHFQKMIASLVPILAMLTSGELGAMLSPDVEDVTDPRPITDSAKAINKGQVLYIGTDSLSDPTVGAAIGSIILSDITATAGDRYNYGVNNDRKVSIFIDEAAEVINDPTIALLNKGRGAGFTAYVATQTFSDFAARLGSEDKARMVMGNLNNLIAMRSKDRTTQDFIVETFGTTTVYEMMHSTATTSIDKGEAFGSFSGGYGERLVENSEADLISADMLGRLPNLHFIASISGGRIIKGRVPIIRPEKETSLDELSWYKKAA